MRPYRHPTHLPALAQFSTIDRKADSYPFQNPYLYDAANPIAYIDPIGQKVEGVTKNDAALVVQDFRAMFPGDEFEEFRKLIVQSGKKQNGKALAKISPEALSSAFNGVALNADQQALVEMVVNTVNSDDIHKVEYFTPGESLSQESIDVYSAQLSSVGIKLNNSNDYISVINALCGEASTVQTQKGSLTLIQKTDETFVTNRPATLGHEVIGHGRSYRLGYTDAQSQHVMPIQVENLILRNMGIPLYRDGSDHAPLNTIIPNYMSIPIFR